jgi:tryptophan synthase alpha chain
MNNLIDKTFQDKNKLKIMTHVVAGYPSIKTNKEIIKVMVECGVDLIEIQIPFSDPMADGPTIMKANQFSLDNRIKIDDCFEMVKDLKKEIDTPLLFMTYANVPFNIGMEKFIKNSSEAGISGLIIPDLPFDEDNDEYIQISQKYNIHPIQVISPDMDTERIKTISNFASGFIYTTLKVGITGAQKVISDEAFDFLKSLKNIFSIPIAAGFGISKPEHLEQLRGKVDMAIIGSHIINIFDESGLNGVRKFLKEGVRGLL